MDPQLLWQYYDEIHLVSDHSATCNGLKKLHLSTFKPVLYFSLQLGVSLDVGKVLVHRSFALSDFQRQGWIN